MQNRFDFIEKALSDATARGQLRTLKTIRSFSDAQVTVDRSQLTNLCSNDYLRLSEHPEVISESVRYIEKYGTGSTASRLVAGNWEYHELLENQLSEWLNQESALLFSSGFQLNATIIPALSDRNTTLFYDRLNHNSLVQGALASRARLVRHRHLDYTHLEQLLSAEDPSVRKIIVTESVFSMDGDIADIHRLVEISRRYNAILIVDEAHAIGVFGEQGRGIADGCEGVDLVIGTFGKAYGSAGAFVACPALIRSYLINYCAGFIYSTAPPPSVVGASIKSLELIRSMNDQRVCLQKMSGWMREQLKGLGLQILRSESHIIPIVIGPESSTVKLSDHLQQNGFLCQAIRPPTVEQGTSRLRITLNTKLTMEELQRFLEVLQFYVSSEHDTI